MLNLIIFALPVAAIFLMFRSQKKRQQQMQSTQNSLQPGSGVRTIGGMYALVKAVNEETVELEIAPGVVTHFIKSAIAAVLDPQEYDAIINGAPAEEPLALEDAEEAADEVAGEAADVQPVGAVKDAVKDADKSDTAGTDGETPATK